MPKIIIVQRHLIYNLVVSDINSRFLGSFFGFLGSIINPLLILLIYTFVFSGILKVKNPGPEDQVFKGQINLV
jgi:ABC-type polysaccharide/polyol phosphate export permease